MYMEGWFFKADLECIICRVSMLSRTHIEVWEISVLFWDIRSQRIPYQMPVNSAECFLSWCAVAGVTNTPHV